MKQVMFTLCVLLLGVQTNFGEIDQNFPNTLMFVVGHVSSDFSLLRGKRYIADESHPGERYVSKGKVMGARWNDIVHEEAGWRYEGLLYEGELPQLRKYYEEHERQLREPMHNAGYTRTQHAHKDAALSGAPDLIFTWKTGSPVIKLIIVPGTRDGVYKLLIQVMK